MVKRIRHHQSSHGPPTGIGVDGTEEKKNQSCDPKDWGERWTAKVGHTVTASAHYLPTEVLLA